MVVQQEFDQVEVDKVADQYLRAADVETLDALYERLVTLGVKGVTSLGGTPQKRERSLSEYHMWYRDLMQWNWQWKKEYEAEKAERQRQIEEKHQRHIAWKARKAEEEAGFERSLESLPESERAAARQKRIDDWRNSW